MTLLRSFGGLLIAGLLFIPSVIAGDPVVGLVDAVKHGDDATIRALLVQRTDVNAPEVDGTTALHWAAQRDDWETANLLVRSGANVKAKNRYAVTPLELACVNGNAAIIELLLKGGADANAGVDEGEPILLIAARTGKVDAVRALLARGADVNAQENETGQTALMWAAAEGNTEVVVELIERGANIHARSKGGFTPFLFAVREGRIGAVRAMLKAGADINEKSEGSGWVVENQMKYLGGTGVSALILAASNAHYELAAALLDAGADPNGAAQGWTALHQVSWVRKAGTGTNNPAREGSGNMSSLEFVRTLVAHGTNVNARMTKPGPAGGTVLNMKGATPFLMAARAADAELMRVLAELGADPLLPNEDNTTPIMVAAGVGTKSPGEDPGTESEVLEAVKVALALGGDVNGVDNNGETVMHGAAYKQVPSVVQFLADHGAKVAIWNTKNKRIEERYSKLLNKAHRGGWTPLRIAEGVYTSEQFRSSPATAAVLRKIMSQAGVSTIVDPLIE